MFSMRCNLTVLMLTLCASSSAQVPTEWTYELMPAGTFPTNYYVRDAGADNLGNVLVAGSLVFNGPTGATSRPFSLLVNGSATNMVPFFSDNFFSASGVAASPGGAAVYTVVQRLGGTGVRIQKTDSSGAYLWHVPELPVSAVAPGCLVDALENVYIATKIFPSGQLSLWSWDASGAGRFMTPSPLVATPRALAFDSAGDVVVGASSPARLAKFSSSGAFQWETTGGMGTDLRRIVWDTNGSGYVLVDGNRVQQVDASGALGWSVILPGGNYEDMAVDQQHGVIVTGHPTAPFVTRRYDAGGNLVWERIFSVSLPYTLGGAKFVRIDTAGNAIVAGELRQQSGVYDGAYVSYTPDGTLRWSGIDSSAGRYLHPRALVVVPDGGFAIAGDLSATTSTEPGLHVRSFRPQSLAFCFGDGSGNACPCSNQSSPGDQSGCTNSFGTVAHLADGGIASITSDTLVLTSSGEAPSAVTLVFQGATAIASTPFGDGLRCVGGTIQRLYTKTAIAGVVTVPGSGDPSISARSAAQGDVLAAGSLRYYQAMYRDPNPTFCPRPSGSTWNMSSGLVMTWGP